MNFSTVNLLLVLVVLVVLPVCEIKADVEVPAGGQENGPGTPKKVQCDEQLDNPKNNEKTKHLTEDSLRSLKKSFDRLRNDDKCSVTIDELKTYTESMKKNAETEYDLTLIRALEDKVTQMSTDDKKEITFGEFCLWLAEDWDKDLPDDIEETFEALTRGDSDELPVRELKEALASADNPPTEAEVTAAIKSAGCDGKEKVNLEEFRKIINLLRDKE